MAEFHSLDFPGICHIKPRLFHDDRGYFTEFFRRGQLSERLSKVDWSQENISVSRKGVLRGMHYQIGPMAQNKLVSVLYGEVLDIALDIRPWSETFGQYFTQQLSGENLDQIFIPAGFAHGFMALSEKAVFYYKVDKPYAPECERGIFPADPSLGLPWPLPENQWLLSEKDRRLPLLKDAEIFTRAESSDPLDGLPVCSSAMRS